MERAEQRLHTLSTNREEYGFAQQAFERARARLQAKAEQKDRK